MREIDRKCSIKRKKLVKTTTFVTLLVAAILMGSAVTGITMNMNEKTTVIENEDNGEGPLGIGGESIGLIVDPEICAQQLEFEHPTRDPINANIVWDNGMTYSNMGSAQDDTQYPLLSEMADDFKFTSTQAVHDVHWVGGYWNPPGSAPFDWRIRFYKDAGGEPGDVPYGGSPFVFAWDDINKVDLGNGYFQMDVDIPTVVFNAGVKYWISIQGVGFFPPQSG
ncbi:MAG: hypothetical protein KAW45_09690, partial [Thermoplasmatales archaeon]|nr:hypothetical protein [Thermoplasmatales archaeon]